MWNEQKFKISIRQIQVHERTIKKLKNWRTQKRDSVLNQIWPRSKSESHRVCQLEPAKINQSVCIWEKT